MTQHTHWFATALAATLPLALAAAGRAQTPEQEKNWAADRDQAQAAARNNTEQLMRARAARAADPMSWVRTLDPLSSGGWEFRAVAKDGSWAAYTTNHQMKRSGKTTTVWLRQEYAEPQTADGMHYMSVVEKSEYDCAHERTRAVLIVYYSGNNIQGTQQTVEADPKTPMWISIIPGTRDEYNFVWACSAGKLSLN